MSGSFESLDVPPTLISFAVTTAKTGDIVSPEFKRAGHRVCLLCPDYDEKGLPTAESLLKNFETVHGLLQSGRAVAAWTPGFGGAAEGVMKMCFGNRLGFRFADGVSLDELFSYRYGAFVLEMTEDARLPVLGETTDEAVFVCGEERLAVEALLELYEDKLESVYPCNIPSEGRLIPNFSHRAAERKAPAIKCAKPRVLIPVFPGTNCEYDSARAVRDAGAEPEIMVISNLTSAHIARSAERFAARLAQSQMIFIPGGFSGGDEPDGSGKFITAFFRNPEIREQVTDLLEKRDGLILGVCNGFQALIKLGLVPFGKIVDADENSPTLSFNRIGRHQSRIVRVRVASDLSPWLAKTRVGEICSVPISHGEGRVLMPEALALELAAKGQIATQYVDHAGFATDDVRFNPNDSVFAIEGLTSPDGRVLGKMGHAERIGSGLYKNVPGDYDMKLFASAVEYFK